MRYLYYHGAVTPAGARNAATLLNMAFKEGEAEVTLCICSDGGDITAGMGLFHFIQMLPIPVHTHAMSFCGSIAATIFLAGQRRTCTMDCVFTTHQGTYVEGPLIGQRTPNTSVFAEPFRNLLGWTTDEINARFGPADFRIHSGDSVSLKITHEVTDVKMGGQDTMVIVGIP